MNGLASHIIQRAKPIRSSLIQEMRNAKMVRRNVSKLGQEWVHLYAYEVQPQRLDKEIRPAAGGLVEPTSRLKTAMQEFFRQSRLDRQPRIGFRPHQQEGQEYALNPVRDLVLQFLSQDKGLAQQAAQQLANRLSLAMDDRSQSCLLVLTATRESEQSRFVAWAFPKDDPMSFGVQGKTASIEIIQNAFSRSSTFRKAVMFVGNHRTDASGTIDLPADQFWQGYVLDRQSRLAQYWLEDFLDCQSLLNGAQGTRLLADLLKDTHATVERQEDQEQITSALLALRASQRKSWTLNRFAKEYLAGAARQYFLQKSPPAAQAIPFQLDKQVLQDRVGWRVFQLPEDVTVVAPVAAVGQTVQLSRRPYRYLKCEGQVVAETVSARKRGA